MSNRDIDKLYELCEEIGLMGWLSVELLSLGNKIKLTDEKRKVSYIYNADEISNERALKNLKSKSDKVMEIRKELYSSLKLNDIDPMNIKFTFKKSRITLNHDPSGIQLSFYKHLVGSIENIINHFSVMLKNYNKLIGEK